MKIQTHVLTNPQDLNAERQQTARGNIGAASQDDLTALGEVVETKVTKEPGKSLSTIVGADVSSDGKVLTLHTTGDDLEFSGGEAAIESISQNGNPITPDIHKNVEITETIQSISVNNEPQTIDANHNVNITIDTPVSPFDTNPLMDGTASPGSSASYSRGDHVHPSDTSKANKSEMVITAVQGDASKKNIQLKNDLSQDVVVAHQDISGKAEKSEMSITDVSSDASKKNIQLKNDLSQDVVVEHQDISGKEDNSNKVSAWSETTTDEHYPSEKLVKGSLDQKEDKSNKVTAWANQPTDTSYPSEKLTKDSLDTKANKSEMSVTTDGDQTTITLKEGTSATVINAHQNISGKAEKSEMAIDDVAGDNTKKKITLKDGLSQDVVVAHQNISDKADKVSGATNGNFAGLVLLFSADFLNHSTALE